MVVKKMFNFSIFAKTACENTRKWLKLAQFFCENVCSSIRFRGRIFLSEIFRENLCTTGANAWGSFKNWLFLKKLLIFFANVHENRVRWFSRKFSKTENVWTIFAKYLPNIRYFAKSRVFAKMERLWCFSPIAVTEFIHTGACCRAGSCWPCPARLAVDTSPVPRARSPAPRPSSQPLLSSETQSNKLCN